MKHIRWNWLYLVACAVVSSEAYGQIRAPEPLKLNELLKTYEIVEAVKTLPQAPIQRPSSLEEFLQAINTIPEQPRTVLPLHPIDLNSTSQH